MGKSITFALLVYGIATVISFFVVLLIKAIYFGLKFSKNKKAKI